MPSSTKDKLTLIFVSAALLASIILFPSARADGWDGGWNGGRGGSGGFAPPPGRPFPPYPGRPPGPVVVRPPFQPGGPRPPFGPPPVTGPRPQPGRPPVFVPPSQPGDQEAIEVNKLTTYIMRGKGCERAGDSLRAMANLLLSSANFASRPGSPAPDQVILHSGEREDEARRRWAGHVRSPHFWQLVWERLSQMYRDCNRGCFDDGFAVGQISATGYCAASIGVDGLDAPGFQFQGSLPVCQTENFTGCLDGYDRAASTYTGCSAYMSGTFLPVYNQSKSQDCHVE